MKELIYSVSSIIHTITYIVIFILLAMHVRKAKTSRHLKISRNLCMAACISALIACFSLKSISLSVLIYPILAVPIWLFNTILDHKYMLHTKEAEKREAEFLKTQPIDVEFKELN